MRTLQVRKRTALVFLLMLAFLGILGGRLIYIQGIWASWLQARAEGQRLHQIPVDARRGKIEDRYGMTLAASRDADCVGVTPAEVREPAKTAAILAKILNRRPAELERLLRIRQAFVWIERRLNSAQAEAIKEERLPGVIVLPKAQRFYPTGGLAGQVLGFAGSDNQGLEGLEVYYDPYLRGRQGWDMAEFSAVGRHIPGGEKRYQEPVDGDTLVLTIDSRLQFLAERELERAVTETGSKRGLVVLMSPKGEILAMANRPFMDPGKFLEYPQESWKNISVTNQLEPGSTFKIITAAAALEEGVVTTKTVFYDPGYLTVDDRHLHCWLDGGHGSQTFAEATENSCNPVFASVALTLGNSRFLKYIKAFGFGSRTGIDFPGEAVGSVPKITDKQRVELATMGFGQGISVTPIQLVAAMAALANGGYLYRPYLLQEMVGPDKKVVRRGTPQLIRQVISRQTAATMRSLLESVVVNGSGNRAAVPGYRIAGKTGTAQKAGSGGGYGSEVVASFLGFAPADNPALIGLVLLDEPSCAVRYGGVIAAPVFGRIISSALRTLKIPATVVKAAPAQDAAITTVPNVFNLPPAQAAAALAQAGLKSRMMGDGSFVFDQVPKPGAQVAPGTAVLLYFDPAEKYNELDEKLVVVPDLTGLKPDAAERILAGLGLRLAAVGEGLASAQEPKAGSRVRSGTPITVRFAVPVKG